MPRGGHQDHVTALLPGKRSHDPRKMAALTAENFAALQSLLKASSKDVVRQLCQESFSTSALGSRKLLDITCSSLSVTQEEAEQGSPSVLQLLQALHRLTRLAAFCDLSSAEAILALFPENFHQNLKNLLTKIILEHVSTWRTEAQANLISLPRLVDLDWRVDIKTASDSISRMAVPTCLLQLKIQEDPSLCGDKPSVSAVTMELSKETLDTMLDGLGRIRDQLSAVANK
ncbi:COMM domain-containing protein 9 isoform X1 [Rhinolophus sinicus]|uniref:COMM domain-containing protein 9 isoform X1 n=1 Tax=Rhinolophus sinicus TaxID=89399 RepID=UPI003D7AAE8A